MIIRKNVPGSLSHRLPINVESTAAVQLVTIVRRAKKQSIYVLRGPLVTVEPPDLDHLVQKLKMIVISVLKDNTVSQVKKGGHVLSEHINLIMVPYLQATVKTVIQDITVNTLKLNNQLDPAKQVTIVLVNQLNLDHVVKISTALKHQKIQLIVPVVITVLLQPKSPVGLDSTVH